MSTGRCVRDFERRKKASEDDSISEVVGEFTRRMTWTVGFDHRAFPDDCGGGGHGQHGMELRFILIGADGAVQWMVNWGDMVPGNVDSIGGVPHVTPPRDMMSAYDLGRHWRHPTYMESCGWMTATCSTARTSASMTGRGGGLVNWSGRS